MQLGRAGFRVLLLDRSPFPRPKVCGEGLMPSGHQLLQELGLFRKNPGWAGRAFAGIRFVLPGNEALQLDFREASSEGGGLVVPRFCLDHALVELARAQPGIHFLPSFQSVRLSFEASRVSLEGRVGDSRESVTGRLLLGADGIRSGLHRRLGIGRTIPRRKRFALRGTHHCPELDGPFVQVFCSERGEAYIAPLGEGRIRITFLLNGGELPSPSSLAELYRLVLREFSRRYPVLPGNDPEPPVAAAAPLSLRVSRCHSHRLLLLGDAGGSVDPVTGQGISHALKDARLAASLLGERLSEDRLSEPELRIYSERRRAYFEPAFETAEYVLRLLRHPSLARRAASALDRHPDLRRRIVSSISSQGSIPPLSVLDRLRLWSGF